MAPDLLSKIHDEIDERLRELRPLLAEYEGLLVACDALVVASRDGSSSEPTNNSHAKRARRSARVAPARRGSAAGAIRRAKAVEPHTELDGDRGDQAAKPAASTVAKEAATPVDAGAREKSPPSARGVAREAILAALEHGSHTVGELTVVTAMSGPSINGHLRRLVAEGAVAKTEREGKAAWALSGIGV